MKRFLTLQQLFEACLKKEGLYAVVPDDRWESLFTLPIVLVWFILLWIIQIYLILNNSNYEKWPAALLFMPLLLIASFILLSAFLIATHFKEIKSGEPPKTLIGTLTLGNFTLYIFPLIVAIATGIYLKSLWMSIYQLGLSTLDTIIIYILHHQKFRVHLFIEFIRSSFKVLIRSAALILVLLPVLLVPCQVSF